MVTNKETVPCEKKKSYLQIKDSFQVCVETRGYESAWSQLKTHIVLKELLFVLLQMKKQNAKKPSYYIAFTRKPVFFEPASFIQKQFKLL